MITLEDAVKQILDNVSVMGEEELPLIKCLGQVTAEDIHSTLSLPQTGISGPDGYAVRAADIANASSESPAVLKILATARAGHPSELVVKAGTAIRIMTGSVIPEGADCVIRFEDTDEPADKNGPNVNNPSEVRIFKTAKEGDNIRPEGTNVRKGALIVPCGTLIGPNHISALACIGRTHVKVVRRPVVAVIATGDELVNPGDPLEPGNVYNSNGPAIASFVMRYGGEPKILGIARDTEDSLISEINKGMDADVIITSGGVSKGDYDLVRLVMGKLGTVVFSRLKMGPGASMAFGTIKKVTKGGNVDVPILSLSGPPVGCLVNLETLVRPALMKMRGLTQTRHPSVKADAVDGVSMNIPISFARWSELKRQDGRNRVTVNLSGKIGELAAIAGANCLTIVPEGNSLKSGDNIEVLPLSWHQDEGSGL